MNLNEFHSFIPGTRANPREMNENFNFVLEEISTKANSDLSNLSKNGQDYIKNSSISKNIGELVYSCIPQTDSSLHLLDGSVLRNNGMYQNFVNYIANLSQNYPDLFTSETAWQQSVIDYGVCGKFVYDSTNNTVRLPKVTGIIEGTTDITALGDLVEAGLPVHTHTRGTMNITGNINRLWGDINSNGAFSSYMSGGNRPAGGGYSEAYINFDASRNWTGSTSIPDYTDNIQNSPTVQPQTIKCFIYIVIANSAKTEIQVDIDEIATDLNGKADTDLTNVTDTAMVMMAGLGMPSGTYVDLTLGANGTKYIAPANGYYCLYKIASGSNQFIQMCNVGYNNESVTNMVFRSVSNNDYISCTMPCAKGQRITVNYTLGGDTIYFRFCYAQGSESEAS